MRRARYPGRKPLDDWAMQGFPGGCVPKRCTSELIAKIFATTLVAQWGEMSKSTFVIAAKASSGRETSTTGDKLERHRFQRISDRQGVSAGALRSIDGV